ncbi:hypothetical protein [Streptomyces sp. NPDC097610]|uniref:TolB family protein n=1 Tax=Streptomyces sp. NPDC097610 TaxID=3157227 RepID=UPI0033277E96
MRIRRLAVAALTLLAAALLPGASARAAGADPAKSPLDALPPYIRQLPVPAGAKVAMRPEFTPDGRGLFVIDENGEVYVYRLDRSNERGAGQRPKARILTKNFAPKVLRAHPLTNGDLVLCAPADANGGRLDGRLWLMQRPLGKRAPVLLGDRCWEGIATSRGPGSTMVAWASSDYNFYDPARDPLTARSQLFTGRIAYDRKGRPSLVDKKLLLDRHDVAEPLALLEPQDFRTVPGRPGADQELVFTLYGWMPGGAGEVLGVDLASRKIVDYSRSPRYDEAEGIDPAGRWIAVERDTTSTTPGAHDIDIWRLSLDGQAVWERLTYFTEFEGYGANQPVISPDSRWMVFNMRKSDSDYGDAEALLVFDLKAWQASGQGRPSTEPDRLPPYSPPQ